MHSDFVSTEARRLAAIAVIGILAGSLFVAFVPGVPTEVGLPSDPGLRLALVALTVICFLLAASLVRHIPDPAARIAGATALVVAGLWFALDVADLGRLAGAQGSLGARPLAEILGGAALLAVGVGTIVVSLRLVRAGGTARRPW